MGFQFLCFVACFDIVFIFKEYGAEIAGVIWQFVVVQKVHDGVVRFGLKSVLAPVLDF